MHVRSHIEHRPQIRLKRVLHDSQRRVSQIQSLHSSWDIPGSALYQLNFLKRTLHAILRHHGGVIPGRRLRGLDRKSPVHMLPQPLMISSDNAEIKSFAESTLASTIASNISRTSSSDSTASSSASSVDRLAPQIPRTMSKGDSITFFKTKPQSNSENPVCTLCDERMEGNSMLLEVSRLISCGRYHDRFRELIFYSQNKGNIYHTPYENSCLARLGPRSAYRGPEFWFKVRY
jgi:hypothetical protein